VELGQIIPGFLAEFGITVDVQHANIEIRYLEGPFKIPRLGEVMVGDNQFPPEFPVGSGRNIGKKTPVKPLYQLENPKNHPPRHLTLQDGPGKLFQAGKSTDLPADNLVAQERKQFIFGCSFSKFA
jgi:hypothetical protein